MIRNIPNKYTHTMLIEAIDNVCMNRYDFFYLPLDHKVKQLIILLINLIKFYFL